MHEEELATLIGQQTKAKRRAAHARTLGCKAKVAGEREGEAGLNGDAVDGGDRQLVEIPHRRVQRLGEELEPVVGPKMVVVAAKDRRHELR